MRGLPAIIQTREDLQNLFALARQGDIDIAKLAEKTRSLLALQYHSVPIVSVDGAKVITRYFPEVSKGDSTEGGLTVKGVNHIESDESPDSETTQYETTEITLSKAPTEGAATLSIYKAENHLVQNGFDIAEINYILGVLDNA